MQYKRGGGRGFENNIGFRNEVLVSKSPTESIQNFKKVLHISQIIFTNLGKNIS